MSFRFGATSQQKVDELKISINILFPKAMNNQLIYNLSF